MAVTLPEPPTEPLPVDAAELGQLRSVAANGRRVSVTPAPQKPASPRTEPPDASMLVDRMPDWFKTSRRAPLFAVFLGLAFVFFSYQPLWHTDLWGHLAYGRLIWSEGAIPATEPLMPLAEGVRFVDTAWLSQLIGYGIHRAFGVPGLQFLFAAGVTLCLAMLAWRIHRRTGSTAWAVVGGLTFLAVNWQQLVDMGWQWAALIRPQLAGLVCFTALLCALTSRKWRRVYWIGAPLLFALWANLHGSFLVGLAAIGAFCVGGAIDVYRRTGNWKAMLSGRKPRRYFLLLELAGVAALLNPYGAGLYAEVLTFASNANLGDLIEWESLSFGMRQGRTAAVAALVLAILYRFSPRRVSASEVLLLAGLAFGALCYSRMIVWCAPPAALFIALHGHAVWQGWSRKGEADSTPVRKSTWTVVAAGLVWIFFAYTPFGVTLLHGADPKLEQRLSENTPVGAVGYLHRNPPSGQVFNSFEWGDYLAWAGPREMRIFVASHAHLVPREVWEHYLQIAHAGGNWEEMLDRYGVTAVVVDKLNREALIAGLRENNDWRVAYEDGVGVVFVRADQRTG